MLWTARPPDRDPDPGVPPWAGKSALSAWFVLHPPAEVDVVSFFITVRLASEAKDLAAQSTKIKKAGERPWWAAPLA